MSAGVNQSVRKDSIGRELELDLGLKRKVALGRRAGDGDEEWRLGLGEGLGLVGHSTSPEAFVDPKSGDAGLGIMEIPCWPSACPGTPGERAWPVGWREGRGSLQKF